MAKSPGGSDGKESTCNAGDLGSIPGLGRSPGEGHGNPLQYSCVENSMDRGAWWATVHGVAKSQDTTARLRIRYDTTVKQYSLVWVWHIVFIPSLDDELNNKELFPLFGCDK